MMDWLVYGAVMVFAFLVGRAFGFQSGVQRGWLEGRLRLHDSYLRDGRLKPEPWAATQPGGPGRRLWEPYRRLP